MGYISIITSYGKRIGRDSLLMYIRTRQVDACATTLVRMCTYFVDAGPILNNIVVIVWVTLV